MNSIQILNYTFRLLFVSDENVRLYCYLTKDGIESGTSLPIHKTGLHEGMFQDYFLGKRDEFSPEVEAVLIQGMTLNEWTFRRVLQSTDDLTSNHYYYE